MRQAACRTPWRVSSPSICKSGSGQSVVVENRASGAAAAAVSALMGAPADGYTFLVTDGGRIAFT
jgi:tripartite-type tricarboxylate transporter receptor subunit TctC